MTDARTLGTDISVWQDDNSTAQQIDFAKMASAGAKFTFVKASQADWIDPDLVYNWQEAKYFMLRSAYHFLDWTTDPLIQARRFYNTVKLDIGELPPMADYECRTNPPTPAVAISNLDKFCLEVEQLFAKTPIIYTSPSYWHDYGSSDPKWARYPLYIAHWLALTPTIPAPWTAATFWQWTNKGDGPKFGAESLQIDLDYFMGTEDELYTFAGIKRTNESPDELYVMIVGLQQQLTELGDKHNALVTLNDAAHTELHNAQIAWTGQAQKWHTELATKAYELEQRIAELERWRKS